MQIPWWGRAQTFLATCHQRILDGEPKYGPVRDDPRCRSDEAILETYDVQNYTGVILLAKHPELKNHPLRLEVQRLNFKLYLALRQLKIVEDELTRKKGGTN